MKRSKALNAAAAKVDRERLYAPLEAVRLAKDTSTTKMPDLNANDIEMASRIIAGTARSMGITVEG